MNIRTAAHLPVNNSNSSALREKLESSLRDSNATFSHPYGDSFDTTEARDATWDIVRSINLAERDFNKSHYGHKPKTLSFSELQSSLADKAGKLNDECEKTAADMPTRLDVLKQSALGFAMGAGGVGLLSIPILLVAGPTIPMLGGLALVSAMTVMQGAAALGESELHDRGEAQQENKTKKREMENYHFASEMLPKWAELL